MKITCLVLVGFLRIFYDFQQTVFYLESNMVPHASNLSTSEAGEGWASARQCWRVRFCIKTPNKQEQPANNSRKEKSNQNKIMLGLENKNNSQSSHTKKTKLNMLAKVGFIFSCLSMNGKKNLHKSYIVIKS